MEEENLFPEDLEDSTFDEEELVEDEETIIGYKKSVNFDDEIGDLLLDGSGSVLECSPIEAWVQWCTKVIETPRSKCLAYSDDIGIDAEAAMQAQTREEAESLLFSEISEALSADPYDRTSYVQSITFDWLTNDSVEVEVIVVGIDDVAQEVTATITA